jgi:predicted nucleotidyltransferase
MKDITNNEMVFVLSLFKSPEIEYNANSMAKLMGISRMGSLKIARRLEKENIIKSKELGKAKFYRLNLDNDYVRQYVKFLLKREAEQAHPYVKAWIEDIKKVKSADAAILFGSILKKHKDANDIDVLFMINKKNYTKVKKEIDEINSISMKRIHTMYQTKESMKKNIKKGDKPLLSAVKGIVVFGEDKIINLIRK